MRAGDLPRDAMNRTAVVFATMVLLVASVAGTAFARTSGAPVSVGQAGSPAPGTSNETTAAAAPGAHLAGVVGVQGAEVEGELAGRRFGLEVARTGSNGSRADLVAEQLSDLDQRLATLQDRKRALIDARENGSVSEARYRAEVAVIATRTAAIEHRLNQSAAVSNELPTDLAVSRGVDTAAIDEIRSDTRELSGPDVADIARSIGGPNAGRGLATAGNGSDGPPGGGDGGPPGRPDTSTNSDTPGALPPSGGQGKPADTGGQAPPTDVVEDVTTEDVSIEPGPPGDGAGNASRPDDNPGNKP